MKKLTLLGHSMMRSCPKCNTNLVRLVKFCGNCGVDLSSVVIDDSVMPIVASRSTAFFASVDVKKAISQTVFISVPSIANRLTNLLEKYGVIPIKCIFESDPSVFAAKTRLFLNSSSAKDTQYICIIGDWNNVPPYELPNPIREGDGDEFCQSDAPYGCINEVDIDKIFELIPDIQVGRIPTLDINVIERVLITQPKINKPSDAFLMGVTTESWSAATQAIVEGFKGGHSKIFNQLSTFDHFAKGSILVSPECVESNLKNIFLNELQCSSNILLFNVHGQADEPNWIGESEDGIFCEIFEPGTISNFNNSVLISEACYGGAMGYDSPSVVEHFFANDGLVFVGSSNIAYGSRDENLSAADLIALHFLIGLEKGLSFGEALNIAKFEALTNDPFDDDIAQKTVLSFNLFGAPWHTVKKVNSRSNEMNSNDLNNKNNNNTNSVLDRFRNRETSFRLNSSRHSLNDIRAGYRDKLPLKLRHFLNDSDEARKRISQFRDADKIQRIINQWELDNLYFKLESVEFENLKGYRLSTSKNSPSKQRQSSILLLDANGKLNKTIVSKEI